MSETFAEYKQRLLGYTGDQDPVAVLQTTLNKLKSIVPEASSEKLQHKQEGRWSAAQVLTHLAEGEIVISYRLRTIRNSSGASIQAYDQDTWVNNAKYLIDDPKAAFRLFAALREANIAFLKALPKEAWEYYGIHSERGKETLRDTVYLFAGHDINHVRQLEQAL